MGRTDASSAGDEWTVLDCFCGIGGYSIGALEALRANGVPRVHFVGVDCDRTALGAYKNAMTSLCAGLDYRVSVHECTLGRDPFAFPAENGRLIVAMSPPCQAFSRARIHRGDAFEADRRYAVELVRFCFGVVVAHDYRRFSIENVATHDMAQLVDEYHRAAPGVVAASQACTFNAKTFRCASERLRLFAMRPETAAAMCSANPFVKTTAREALESHGLVPPDGACLSNGNKVDGRVCMRGLDDVCFTITASHAPLFVTKAGVTIRSLTLRESAALVGMPPDVVLPKRHKDAQRCIGNVVSPWMSRAIVHTYLSSAPSTGGPKATGMQQRIDALCAQADAAEAAVRELRSALLQMRADAA